MAPPFKEVEVDIIYGYGISKEGDILDLASEVDIVDKSGSWYSFNGERLGQGRENSKEFLKNNPVILREIENLLRERYELPTLEVLKETMPEIGDAIEE